MRLLLLAAVTSLRASAFTRIDVKLRSPQAIASWHVLGPFVVGKGDLDGDPLWDVEGGPVELAARIAVGKGKKATFPSEYAPGGHVKWSQVTASADGSATVAFNDIDWNGLVQIIGGMEVVEWQALLVGRFTLSTPTQALVACSGVAAFFIDQSLAPIAADAYFGQWSLGNVTFLDAGAHYFRLRLRARHRGQVSCSVKVVDTPKVEISSLFVPDWVIGESSPSGGLVALSVQNVASDWIDRMELQLTGAMVPALSLSEPFSWASIAPGQRSCVRFRLAAAEHSTSGACAHNVDAVTVSVSVRAYTRAGVPLSSSVALSLRCRTAQQSVLMTFADRDGSVQHAAVIRPPAHAQCLRSTRGCAVLLTLHGTSISARDSADAFKVHCATSLLALFCTGRMLWLSRMSPCACLWRVF